MKPLRAGLIAGAVHLAAVILTELYVVSSTDGQAILVWVRFTLVDLPISFLYLADVPLGWLHQAAPDLFWPAWIHGVAGTAWWALVVGLASAIIQRLKGREKDGAPQ